MNYDEFFRQAFGGISDFSPFDYQRCLAEKPWPDLLDVPTGMGKTAAVTLAWSWKRGWRVGKREADIMHGTPRRLVWCLPMRVLVEQTAENVQQWLQRLNIYGKKAGEGKVSVHVLMGGADDLKSWAEYPEEDMILIGTQDMLLSRALMRGYGMSRYQWPIHFALLHNDCLWALDEIQLMGAGLATSAQLEAFRRGFPLAKSSRTLWISATLRRDWLNTIDMRPHLDTLIAHTINDTDRQQAGERLKAVKTLQKAPVSLTGDNIKQKAKAYLEALAELVLDQHDTQSQTLVIVNRVERAQELFCLLRKQRPNQPNLLIHARFRARERREQALQLRQKSVADRIIVATQAIEAGVDISSRTLVTELAPWASMVQRFGRCNRYGEYNASGAQIHWIDIQDDADPLPYTAESLAASRDKLTDLASASPQDLPAVDQARPLTAVLRCKDLLELFNTDPDLSGFDVDVSDYIRDSGTPGVQVFWRAFKDDPNTSAEDDQPEGKPERKEICPVSMSQITAFIKRKGTEAWYWDALGDNKHNGPWVRLTRNPRPGMMLLLRASDGGYDEAVGFDALPKKSPVPVLTQDTPAPENTYDGDWRSRQNRPVPLPDHLQHVATHADQLCQALGNETFQDSVVRAGRWHDLGKLHEVFQHSMYRCRLPANPDKPLAKSNCPGPMRHTRKYFRHELASMLAWLAQHDGEPDADLIAYLIVAHHGKVRMSLRAMPGEQGGTDVKRFARGVHEDDALPALDFNGEHSQALTLKLGLMELGEGEQGASWTERTLKLLDDHGPFRLAWLETLVRLADWRASAEEQEQS